MRVSVTLHKEQPPEWGNQRDKEARYGGFNRRYAEMGIDPQTGYGLCEFHNMAFPQVLSDAEVLTHFSIGVCCAPEGYGGAIIIAGPLEKPVAVTAGMVPKINHAACVVERFRLERLGLIKQERGRFVELTEQELRAKSPPN